jgi:hypothetical protein
MSDLILTAQMIDFPEASRTRSRLLREAKRRCNLPPDECVGFAGREIAASLRSSQ